MLLKFRTTMIFMFTFMVFIYPQSKLYSNENIKPVKIVHFYSDRVGFWPLASSFAAAAAEDLNVEFESYSFGHSPIVQIELITKVLNDPKTKPDGFIFHNYKNRGEQILKIAQKANVPAVMFNAGPTPKDNFGNPREKYPLYLGLITPDDEKAGYDLAKNLISLAKSKNLQSKDGKIHICIMEGSRFSNAAKLRKKGLKRALKEHSDVVVDQSFDVNWSQKQAIEAFRVAVKRYPDTKVFWSASDSMAEGITIEAKSIDKQPGVDFIIGGIDLLPSIQPKVLSGEIALSIGAHYTESIWALTFLHDYLKGCNQVKKGETPVYKSTMMTLLSTDKPLLPKETKEEILSWAKGIDFKEYSKCYSNKEYSFNSMDFFKNNQ